MTTPPKTKPTRRRFRLSGLEMFGFIETPGVASAPPTRLVEVQVEAVVVPNPASPSAVTENGVEKSDPFKDWKPEEVESRLVKGRVRWGLVASMVVILTGIAFTAYWVYQLPQAEARQAREAVVTAAGSLETSLADFESLNSDLAASALNGSRVNQVLLDLDNANRELFAAAGRLTAAESEARAIALDLAATVGEAQTAFTQSYTYRLAVIPVLVAPQLETDPSLTDVETAAAGLAEWEARFDSVRTSLPEDVLPEVSTRLNFISAALPGIQQAYLTGLSIGDAEATVDALALLSTSLSQAEALLFDGLADVSGVIQGLVDDSLSELERLRSLFG
jgi:hypothetical protein